MFTEQYVVIVETYAERHYIARFKKKYQKAWDVTRKAIEAELKRAAVFIGVSSRITLISTLGTVRICKAEFRIAGPGRSRHASGYRYIVAIDDSPRIARVLLVYAKTDLPGTNETAVWKKVVRDHYPEYKALP